MDRPIVPVLAITVLLVAGCTAPIGGQSIDTTGVSVSDVMVEAGGTATVTVRAVNVTGMSFTLPGDHPSGPVAVDFRNATVSPPPDIIWTSSPPAWAWEDGPVQVTAKLPVKVPAETDAGSYPLGVTIRLQASAKDGEIRENGTVTVVEN